MWRNKGKLYHIHKYKTHYVYFWGKNSTDPNKHLLKLQNCTGCHAPRSKLLLQFWLHKSNNHNILTYNNSVFCCSFKMVSNIFSNFSQDHRSAPSIFYCSQDSNTRICQIWHCFSPISQKQNPNFDVWLKILHCIPLHLT